ncbi:hypothetical protein FOPE_10764 [Fonsecaea pedrosoi]|nr:hypothetical protein FOPE_10764 [Fonsecaea pedrosoi]
MDSNVDGSFGEELGELVAEEVGVALQHPLDALVQPEAESPLHVPQVRRHGRRFAVVDTPGDFALRDHFHGDRDVGILRRHRPRREVVGNEEVAHAPLKQVSEHDAVQVLDEVHLCRVDPVFAQQHLEEQADAGSADGLHQDRLPDHVSQVELCATARASK